MSTPTQAPPNIGHFAAVDKEYAAPQCVVDSALLKDFKAEYDRSIKDNDGFWAEQAAKFAWTKPWTKVSEWEGGNHKWFLGARTNITVNALDRHAKGGGAKRVAYIWLAEDGTERIVTYGQLYRMVCRFANGLKSIGVKKGDRVIIYMPLTMEGTVAMLACARIGAIHSGV